MIFTIAALLLVLIVVLILRGGEHRPDNASSGNAISRTSSYRDPGEVAMEQEFRAEYAASKERHAALLSDVRVPKVDRLEPVHHSALSPAKILFLWYLHGKTTNSPKIAMYWHTTYALSNYQATIHSLVKRGFLTVSSNPQDYLSRLTLSQLRDICAQYGFAKNGSKRFIVLFLAQRLPQDALDDMAAKHSTFVVTPSGQEAIAANQGLLVYHAHRNHLSGIIDLAQAAAALKSRPNDDPLIVILEAAGCNPREAMRQLRTMSRSSGSK